MLQQFTWQQFLVATLILTLIWYFSVMLLFYRKELKAFLNGKKLKDENDAPLPHRWDKKVDELQPAPEENLMGKSKLPDGVSIVEMEDIQFANEDNKVQLLGLVSDVIEEIKTIFNILVNEDGTKQDFFKLIEAVKESYSGIITSQHIPQINEFIIANASFHITREELDNLWF
ncbi:MAG: hypothetical protein P0Y49_13775 [Candidatus Pedobacter colombiensis]|uniref:Uncharacterized protein n=1 Tax=Candidatus Pedobacter colombiensis TaxID=3121371 RepID=A0AAJ6B7A5_9SPHI|nr:hypothetical protein [Pedobacter sp.]WEK17868.1 MAG: hypothetical protein P0Y49_13775 [Pedobacter sp.]